METLRAELARAKEQARSSSVAALKAGEELRAEKAAHCESKEKMAKMVVKLKDTANRCQFLEEENQVKATDLEKATMTLALENATGHCEFLEKENKALAAELEGARQEAREA